MQVERKSAPTGSFEDRWQVWIAWQNSTFNAYLEAQKSLGLEKDQALKRLEKIWRHEDRDRLEAHRRAARIFTCAR